MADLRLITLQTDRNEALDNWIYTAKEHDYNYAILGLDEKWGGWSWRTKKYLHYVESLPSSAVVCITDCNDVLFTRPSHEMQNVWAYYQARGKELVFGGEPTCCTGNYRFHIDPVGRKNIMTRVKDNSKKVSNGKANRWMFPNAGCVIGTRDRIVEALTLAKDADDDQARYLEQYALDPHWLSIDYDHKLVGNLNSLAYLYKESYLPEDYYNAELKHWNFISVKDYDEMQRVTRVRKPVNRFLLQNNQTGGIPCVVHFPGKNFVLYNYVGEKLYKGHFKPLDFKDSMTTLWSIKETFGWK